MELKKMSFSTNKDGDTTPKTVSVEMSIEEALWIVKIAGSQRGASVHNEIFNCLTCDVFNPYWEDGVDDAELEFPVEIPPIVYNK